MYIAKIGFWKPMLLFGKPQLLPSWFLETQVGFRKTSSGARISTMSVRVVSIVTISWRSQRFENSTEHSTEKGGIQKFDKKY